jgi:hypothetical protein
MRRLAWLVVVVLLVVSLAGCGEASSSSSGGRRAGAGRLPGPFGIRVEQVALVTDDDCEVLSGHALDLVR